MGLLTHSEIWNIYSKKYNKLPKPNFGVEPDKDFWKRIAAEFGLDKKEIAILKKIKELIIAGSFGAKYDSGYQPSYRTSDESFYNDKFTYAFRRELEFSLQPFSLEHIIRLDSDLPGIDYRIAIAIREKEKKIINLCREAIMGDTDIKLSQRMIIGIIKSDYMPLIEDLGKLLLAAKGQEGVRQSIIEWCDTGSPAAQAYFMKLCIDNNLTRFSSVVRALGCYSGVMVAEMRPAAVSKLFTLCYENLINPRPDTGTSNDVTEIFASLWGLGANNLATAKKAAEKAVDSLDKYRRLVGWYFLQSVDNCFFTYDIAIDRIVRRDPDELALICRNLYIFSHTLQYSKIKGKDDEPKPVKLSVFPSDFTKRKRHYKALGEAVKFIGNKKTVIENCVFDGFTVTLSNDNLATTMLSLICYDLSEELTLDFETYLPFIKQDLRSKYYRILLKPEAPKDRMILLRGLSDKSTHIKKQIVEILGQTEFLPADTDYLTDVLTTVNSDLRKSVVMLFSKQSESVIKSASEKLLDSKNIRQREAGEELLSFLSPNKAEESEDSASFYNSNSIDFDLETARKNLPEMKIYDKSELKNLFFPPMKDVFQFISDIDEIYESHKGEELECIGYLDRPFKTIYGSRYSVLEKKTDDNTGSILNFHFGDEFLDTFKRSGIPITKLEIITTNSANSLGTMIAYSDLVDKYFGDLLYFKTPDRLDKKLENGGVFRCILNYYNKEEPENLLTFEFCMSVFMSLIKLIPEKDYLASCIDTSEKNDPYGVYRPHFRDFPMIGFANIAQWQGTAHSKIKTDEQFAVFWKYVWFLYLATGCEKLLYHSYIDLVRARGLGLISDDGLFRIFTDSNYGKDFIRHFSGKHKHLNEATAEFPYFEETYNKFIDRIVSVEEKRGDLPTPVTDIAIEIKYYEGGAEHFTALIKALEKEKLYRGYFYSFDKSTPSKQLSLSMLLKSCYPKKSDNEKTLKAALEKHNVSEKQVLQAIMYAPQWAGLAEKALGINGLKSAVWLFHAHVNETQNAEKETEIAIYSPISIQEFADGTFDKDWFLSSYNAVGDKVFSELYKNALYITESSSNKHKRSQMYTDAVLGRLDKAALEAEITEKRGQEKLRAYGLIPLDKRDKKDALRRYEFIQKFIKDSKQFGSQRRASEQGAANIALQNLAITTGFTDVDRMTWNFESEITELSGKELKDQKSRAKASFEKAMTARTVFFADEIVKFLKHPVLSEFINPLLLISDNICGFPKAENGKLFLGDTPVSGGVYIAHPYDIIENNSWAAWQKYLFDNKIVQPFKQVFREYYPITADEREDNFSSNRYAGHQVQPKKTVALLKSRGWTVDYEEGLQKVFHKENLIVRLYAAADWFSPADIEAPTLEAIHFTYRGSGKTAPLSEIPPILFSEVMRDIDLVVSVANVGGVDPEASASTVEMRISIARELLSLLKIKNVTFKTAHALIKGHFGEYSVHMGSGIVHQIGVGMIPVLAVGSGQRGRIFLPFADNDPRTAEIISKILLFADDKKIKDPTILAYRK
jgi:hypothetical protein